MGLDLNKIQVTPETTVSSKDAIIQTATGDGASYTPGNVTASNNDGAAVQINLHPGLQRQAKPLSPKAAIITALPAPITELETDFKNLISPFYSRLEPDQILIKIDYWLDAKTKKASKEDIASLADYMINFAELAPVPVLQGLQRLSSQNPKLKIPRKSPSAQEGNQTTITEFSYDLAHQLKVKSVQNKWNLPVLLFDKVKQRLAGIKTHNGLSNKKNHKSHSQKIYRRDIKPVDYSQIAQTLRLLSPLVNEHAPEFPTQSIKATYAVDPSPVAELLLTPACFENPQTALTAIQDMMEQIDTDPHTAIRLLTSLSTELKSEGYQFMVHSRNNPFVNKDIIDFTEAKLKDLISRTSFPKKQIYRILLHQLRSQTAIKVKSRRHNKPQQTKEPKKTKPKKTSNKSPNPIKEAAKNAEELSLGLNKVSEKIAAAAQEIYKETSANLLLLKNYKNESKTRSQINKHSLATQKALKRLDNILEYALDFLERSKGNFTEKSQQVRIQKESACLSHLREKFRTDVYAVLYHDARRSLYRKTESKNTNKPNYAQTRAISIASSYQKALNNLEPLVKEFDTRLSNFALDEQDLSESSKIHANDESWGLEPDPDVLSDFLVSYLEETIIPEILSAPSSMRLSRNIVDWVNYILLLETEEKPELLAKATETIVKKIPPKGDHKLMPMLMLLTMVCKKAKERNIKIKHEDQIIDAFDLLGTVSSNRLGLRKARKPKPSLEKANQASSQTKKPQIQRTAVNAQASKAAIKLEVPMLMINPVSKLPARYSTQDIHSRVQDLVKLSNSIGTAVNNDLATCSEFLNKADDTVQNCRTAHRAMVDVTDTIKEYTKIIDHLIDLLEATKSLKSYLISSNDIDFLIDSKHDLEKKVLKTLKFFQAGHKTRDLKKKDIKPLIDKALKLFKQQAGNIEERLNQRVLNDFARRS